MHNSDSVLTHSSLLSLSLTGLGVYSSESDSDSGGSRQDSKPRSSRDGKSSKSSKRKSGKDVVITKLPKPEEIAAAFRDTKAAVSSKEKPAFMPVPRIVQEKQRDSGKISASSSKPSEAHHVCCHPYFMFNHTHRIPVITQV